ncbi:hypothetical protein M3Y99_00724900 [Aphelenchoides fujianensis]|nr:hypothetical protein M3Y99_00724900 [Aphelenchoides fujianensis]
MSAAELEELVQEFDHVLHRNRMLLDLPFKVVFNDGKTNAHGGRCLPSRSSSNPTPVEMARAGSSGEQHLRASPNDLNATIVPEESQSQTNVASHARKVQQRPPSSGNHTKSSSSSESAPPVRRQRIDEAGRIERARTWSAKERFVKHAREDIFEDRQKAPHPPPPIFSHRSSGLYDSGLGHSEHRRRSSFGFHEHGKRRSSSRPLTAFHLPAPKEVDHHKKTRRGLREMRLMLKQNLIKSNICMERVLEMKKERQIDRQLFHIPF